VCLVARGFFFLFDILHSLRLFIGFFAPQFVVRRSSESRSAARGTVCAVQRISGICRLDDNHWIDTVTDIANSNMIVTTTTNRRADRHAAYGARRSDGARRTGVFVRAIGRDSSLFLTGFSGLFAWMARLVFLFFLSFFFFSVGGVGARLWFRLPARRERGDDEAAVVQSFVGRGGNSTKLIFWQSFFLQ
jgi:hypothetical protein